MAIEIFPTSNDVGGSGTGRSASEKNMIQGVYPAEAQSTILSGMAPGVGTGLDMSIAAGRCLIDGYICRLEDVESFTVTDDATKYVWLQLTGAGSYGVTSAAFVETANLTAPSNSALVTKVISSGGDISSVDDSERREGYGFLVGTYTGTESDAGDTQDIDIGQTPRYVKITNPNFSPSYTTLDDVTHPRESFTWPGNAPLTGYTTSGDFDVPIIKDGFTAKDGSPDGNCRTGVVYSYIAWF